MALLVNQLCVPPGRLEEGCSAMENEPNTTTCSASTTTVTTTSTSRTPLPQISVYSGSDRHAVQVLGSGASPLCSTQLPTQPSCSALHRINSAFLIAVVFLNSWIAGFQEMFTGGSQTSEGQFRVGLSPR